jgi:hypothetical protein
MANKAQRVFSRELTDGAHVHRLDVERTADHAWQIREQRDDVIVRHVTNADWHRVELAISGFSAEAVQLTQRGWRILH